MGDDGASVVPDTASGPSPDGGQAAPPYSGAFGEYLVSQYAVLVPVLSHLNFYDLRAVRAVHTSFKKTADALLKKRSWIQYNVVDCGRGWPARDGRYVDLRIEPATLFTFEFVADPQPTTRNRGRSGDLSKRDIVPATVRTFVHVGAIAVFHPGRKKDRSETTHTVSVMSKRPRLALLYVPASDSYAVSAFTCAVNRTAFPSREIRDFLAADPRPVRGIVFLKTGTVSACRLIRYIVQAASDGQTEPFAVSGGQVATLEFDSPPPDAGGVLKAVVFRGDGIRCVSDYIDVTDPDLVREDLKTTATFVDHTVGKLDVSRTFIMMFQCVDRNGLRDNQHIAAVYPNVPIFGVQTWGEYGHQSYKLPDYSRTPKKRMIPVTHMFKTTYIIVSIR